MGCANVQYIEKKNANHWNFYSIIIDNQLIIENELRRVTHTHTRKREKKHVVYFAERWEILTVFFFSFSFIYAFRVALDPKEKKKKNSRELCFVWNICARSIWDFMQIDKLAVIINWKEKSIQKRVILAQLTNKNV